MTITTTCPTCKVDVEAYRDEVSRLIRRPRTADLFVAPDGNEHPCIWQDRPDADPRLIMARPHEDAPERCVWDMVAATLPRRAPNVPVPAPVQVPEGPSVDPLARPGAGHWEGH